MSAAEATVIALREAGGTTVTPDEPTIATDDGECFPARSYAIKRLELPTLRRVIKRDIANALYDIELDDGTVIPLGPAMAVLDPKRVQSAIADGTGYAPPRLTPAKHRYVANALFAIAEVTTAGASDRDQLLEWLSDLLDRGYRRDVDLDDGAERDEVVSMRAAAFRATSGRLYVQLAELGKLVRNLYQQRLSDRELSAMLQRLDFAPERVQGMRRGRGEAVRKVRYWVSPVGFDPDADSVDGGPVGPPAPPITRNEKTAGPSGATGAAPHAPSIQAVGGGPNGGPACDVPGATS